MGFTDRSAYAEETPHPDPEISASESLLGWSVSGLSGINLCIPSGSARCDETYPGVNAGLSTEYRWKFVGLSANVDWGTLTPAGTGSDQVTHRLSHIGLGLRAYVPWSEAKAYYMGMSAGMGEAVVKDNKSDSSVTWSSLWSDLRLELGGVWIKSETLAIESALGLAIHLGGERCIRFNGAGPCSVEAELGDSEQSSARVMMWRIGVRWIP